MVYFARFWIDAFASVSFSHSLFFSSALVAVFFGRVSGHVCDALWCCGYGLGKAVWPCRLNSLSVLFACVVENRVVVRSLCLFSVFAAGEESDFFWLCLSLETLSQFFEELLEVFFAERFGDVFVIVCQRYESCACMVFQFEVATECPLLCFCFSASDTAAAWQL